MRRTVRTIAIFALVVGLVLGTAVPSLAAAPITSSHQSVTVSSPDRENEHGEFVHGKTKVIRGTVDNITGSVINVDGKAITTNSDTKYKVPGLGRDATLGDIKAGMQIVAQGSEQGRKFVARQVVVVPSKPDFEHRVGNVTAYSYNATSGGSISIQDKKGYNFAFKILPGEFKILPVGSEVKLGDLVTVISHRNPSTNELIASAVVIHQPEPEQEQHEAGLKSISGNVTAMTSANITVGTTVIGYDMNTVFVLKGVSSTGIGSGFGFALTGQQVTVFYTENSSARLAKIVAIGVNLPEALKDLRAHGFED